MASDQSVIPVLPSIEDLASSYDAWLVDIWGVMHNGVRAHEASGEACARFRANGGYVVLVSNAPRPAPAVVTQLQRIGVRDDAYDAMVTSGDVTRGLLQAWQDKRIHHIGPERDAPLFDGLGIGFVGVNEAEIVACTGLLDDETEAPADYEATFRSLIERNAAMLCANPDIMVERGEKLVYCAGALAETYRALGGDVVYSGKPHLPIYDLARAIIADGVASSIPDSRILAIGDGLRTDIRGASDAGLDCVFIASALHVDRSVGLTSQSVAELFADFEGKLPVAAMEQLTW